MASVIKQSTSNIITLALGYLSFITTYLCICEGQFIAIPIQIVTSVFFLCPFVFMESHMDTFKFRYSLIRVSFKLSNSALICFLFYLIYDSWVKNISTIYGHDVPTKEYIPVLAEILTIFLIGVIAYLLPFLSCPPFKLLDIFLADENISDSSSSVATEVSNAGNNVNQNLVKTSQPKQTDTEESKRKFILQLETMNETELQTQLKQAIDKEYYRRAELIKKALERFR